MKTCTFSGCLNPQFGGGYCKYHQYARRMQGGDQHKRKKNTSPPKESRKRKVEHKKYLDRLKEKWDEAVANKTNFCFFCGEYSNNRLSNHHWYGRVGPAYLEENTWCWAHMKCHDMYHHFSVEKLEHQSWYEDFLVRLKAFDVTLWEKQTGKREKSNKLNPTLFDED